MSFYFFLYYGHAGGKPRSAFQSLSEPYKQIATGNNVILAQNLKTGNLNEISLDKIVDQQVYTEKSYPIFNTIMNRIGE